MTQNSAHGTDGLTLLKDICGLSDGQIPGCFPACLSENEIQKHATAVNDDLAALQAAGLTIKKLVSAYRDMLNDPEQWPQVLAELRLSGFLARSGATIDVHVPVGDGSVKNFDVRATRGGSPVNIEVRTIHDEFPRRPSPEYEAKLRETVNCPCGVVLVYRGMPNVVDAASHGNLINAMYSAWPSLKQHSLEVKGCEYGVYGSSIMFPEGHVIFEVRFEFEETPGLLLITGGSRSMADPVFMGDDRAASNSFVERPLSVKIKDAVLDKVVQLPEDGVNVVALASDSGDFCEDVFYAVYGDTQVSYDIVNRTGRDVFVGNGIAYAEDLEPVRKRVHYVLCMSFKDWSETPAMRLYPTNPVLACIPPFDASLKEFMHCYK